MVGIRMTQDLESDEYYTPKFIFDGLKLQFDIDLTAPEGGIDWIPAKRYFTKEQDALKQEWAGKVWLNPPFSKPGDFMHRFLDHKNGVAIVCVSKAKWFERVWLEADGLLFPYVHLKFVHKTKGNQGIFMPVMMVAMGEECVRALKVSGLGRMR